MVKLYLEAKHRCALCSNSESILSSSIGKVEVDHPANSTIYHTDFVFFMFFVKDGEKVSRYF